MENKDGILTFRSSNWRWYQARTVDSMRLHKTLNSCLSSGPVIQYFQSNKARLQSMPCRSMDNERNYLHHVNNYPFPAIPIFSIYVSPFTCTTIVCGKFQYQSCKFVVFLPFSLSCSQERIACLNHKPKTYKHGLFWTKVLPVRLHNPSMSFVLEMAITLSRSICKMSFLFCIIFAPLESHSCIQSNIKNGRVQMWFSHKTTP
jgi:hypothetical protein